MDCLDRYQYLRLTSFYLWRWKQKKACGKVHFDIELEQSWLREKEVRIKSDLHKEDQSFLQ